MVLDSTSTVVEIAAAVGILTILVLATLGLGTIAWAFRPRRRPRRACEDHQREGRGD